MTSAVATAPSAVNQARPRAPAESPGIRCRGGKSTTDIKIDDRGGAVQDRPSATSARGLFFGQDDQAVVGDGGPGPSRQVVGAGHAVPDHDPPPEPASRELVLDLIGTEPLGGTHVGCAAVGVLLDPEAKRDQGRQIISHLLEVRAQLAERHVIARDGAEPVEKSNVQARLSL